MNDAAKIFDEVVSRRRSLRAFLPQAVDQQTLESVFSTAQKSPSNCNTQPWSVHLVSGAKLQSMREQLPSRYMAGEITMDFHFDGIYEGVYKERQYGSAKAMYDAMDIPREDKAARQEAFMRNFSFFDAPHVAFLFLPEPFGLREACDLGMYAQTLMLAMTAHGLGSCPQTSLSFQADLIRELLGVDASHKLLFGMSFGYPDTDAPVNNCITDRAALADVITFHQ